MPDFQQINRMMGRKNPLGEHFAKLRAAKTAKMRQDASDTFNEAARRIQDRRLFVYDRVATQIERGVRAGAASVMVRIGSKSPRVSKVPPVNMRTRKINARRTFLGTVPSPKRYLSITDKTPSFLARVKRRLGATSETRRYVNEESARFHARRRQMRAEGTWKAERARHRSIA